jgi:hypothetical protein
MKISELKDHQIVTCRLGYSGRTGVEWDPWHEESLFISRRPCDFPGLKSRTKWWHKDDLTNITIRNKHWEEYGMCDFHPDPEGGIFTAGNWCLQIKDLTSE